jgi:hypothetical protein
MTHAILDAPPPSMTIPVRPTPPLAPLRLSDLVTRTGFSKTKLLDDIEAGYLAGTQDPRSGIWLIPVAEAQRYLRALGICDVDSTP